MKPIHAVLALFILAACDPAPRAPPPPPPLSGDAEIDAAQAAELEPRDAEWNARVTPFNVIGNIYYVGPANVSSYLIATDDGHFLIDGGYAQSAPQIIENIATLGSTSMMCVSC